MSSQNHQTNSHSHFWSGFTLGAVLGVAGVYFFGTKTGRKNLQKAIDLTENLEDTIEKTIGGVGEDYIEGLAGGVAEQGSIVDEKESLLNVILKAVGSYLQKKHIKPASN